MAKGMSIGGTREVCERSGVFIVKLIVPGTRQGAPSWRHTSDIKGYGMGPVVHGLKPFDIAVATWC